MSVAIRATYAVVTGVDFLGIHLYLKTNSSVLLIGQNVPKSPLGSTQIFMSARKEVHVKRTRFVRI